jgi:hypothetical protein
MQMHNSTNAHDNRDVTLELLKMVDTACLRKIVSNRGKEARQYLKSFDFSKTKLHTIKIMYESYLGNLIYESFGLSTVLEYPTFRFRIEEGVVYHNETLRISENKIPG